MNIGFYGATGSNDFGDWAMMVHNINQIIKYREDVNIFIYTPDKDNTQKNLLNNIEQNVILKRIKILDEPKWKIASKNMIQRIYYKVLYTLHLYNYEDSTFNDVLNGDYELVSAPFVDSMNNLESFIFNGGGYIQHNWGYKNITFLLACIIAKQQGVSVNFLGNSLGPMYNYQKYLEKALPYIDNIIVRDGENYTAKLLKSLQYNNFVCGSDDLLFVNDYYDIEPLLDDDYIVIELMFYISKAKEGEEYILDELVKFIDYVSLKHKIVLINIDCDDWRGIKYIEYIETRVKKQERIVKYPCVDNMYDVFSLYKYADFSLSCKYHPLILSLGSGVPCVGVICDNDGYYESKMKGAFDSCGLTWKDNVVNLNDLTCRMLIPLYENSLENKKRFIIDNAKKKRMKSIYENSLKKYLMIN